MKTRRRPIEMRWSDAISKSSGFVAKASSGKSRPEAEGAPHDLWPSTRDTMATLGLVEAVMGVGWQLEGIRRLLATHDLTQEEVEFIGRLRDAGITDYRAAFDAAAAGAAT